jgi:glucose-1-phosphatase
MPAAIDLVIFDMDDVLGHLDRRMRLELLAAATGQPAELIHERIWASDFEPGAECGLYSTGSDYLAEFNRRLGSNLSRAQWVAARRTATSLNGDVLEIAVNVVARCATSVLTNNGPLLREALDEILPEVERLFGVRAYASCQLGARKPTRLVFERLLARFDVAPARAVFIDDYVDFIEGARAAGLNAIHFSDASALRQDLRALGFDDV